MQDVRLHKKDYFLLLIRSDFRISSAFWSCG